MKFDKETLIEIEDYIQALDEQVGLKAETMQDIHEALLRKHKELKKATWNPPVVIGSCDIIPERTYLPELTKTK
jgi:hypothetical protein